jgi:hypothetical protein
MTIIIVQAGAAHTAGHGHQRLIKLRYLTHDVFSFPLKRFYIKYIENYKNPLKNRFHYIILYIHNLYGTSPRYFAYFQKSFGFIVIRAGMAPAQSWHDVPSTPVIRQSAPPSSSVWRLYRLYHVDRAYRQRVQVALVPHLLERNPFPIVRKNHREAGGTAFERFHLHDYRDFNPLSPFYRLRSGIFIP